MPGRPGGERIFFSAQNLLERKRLGEFLDELNKLQVGAEGSRRVSARYVLGWGGGILHERAQARAWLCGGRLAMRTTVSKSREVVK